LGTLKSPDLVGGYCVFNELSCVLLHIEDERLNMKVCERMKDMGCKAIDKLPNAKPLTVEKQIGPRS
jgi:hypothetical protein